MGIYWVQYVHAGTENVRPDCQAVEIIYKSICCCLILRNFNRCIYTNKEYLNATVAPTKANCQRNHSGRQLETN